MSEEAEKITPKLIDLITPEMGEPELQGLVVQYINTQDEILFGGKEQAIQKVAESLAYLGVFAPAPATFNLAAYKSVSARGLPEKESERLFEISKQAGVIEESKEAPGRVTVSKEWTEISIRQFLT